MNQRWTTISVISSIGVFIGLLQFLLATSSGCQSEDAQAFNTALEFVGSDACQSCHSQEHRLWTTSDHHKALAFANDSTVLGNFNNVILEADGIRSRFFQERDTFFIETEAADGSLQIFPIQYVIGHYPLQQYMVAFPGGRYQVTRQSWDSREGKWFHQYAGDNIAAGDFLHWTGNGQNWNTMCASCHSTHLQKNYDLPTDTYHTSYEEVTIGCESCHGPGSQHIALASLEEYPNEKYGQIEASVIVSSCMPCHARKTDLRAVPVQSTELLDNYIPQIISTDFYFGDGQVKEEDYVYGSFVQSRMHREGVQCLNCHNAHSGKLLQEGNALCLQCHEPSYAEVTHHFHPADSEGAQCINCHMPERTYMGNDHRRDHSFRIPRPDQSVEYGTPNACTSCHSNQSNQWAAEQVEAWYGAERAYHFSDDLLAGSSLEENSVPSLLHLLNNDEQPLIARATAVYYLGQILTEQAQDAIRKALNHQEAWIRFQALNALSTQPMPNWLNEAAPLLADEVLAVRIAAARLFHSTEAHLYLSNSRADTYQSALQEYQDYLQLQADFAVGSMQWADFHLQDGQAEEAVRWYRKALEKDQQMNYARFNLASALSSLQRPEEALSVLVEALHEDPTNSRTHYNLALLYYELQKLDLAENHFQKALQLTPPILGAFANYSLFLLEQGRYADIVPIAQQGLKLSPTNEKLLFALAESLIALNKKRQAQQVLKVLIENYPNNSYYQQMLIKLGY